MKKTVLSLCALAVLVTLGLAVWTAYRRVPYVVLLFGPNGESIIYERDWDAKERRWVDGMIFSARVENLRWIDSP